MTAMLLLCSYEECEQENAAQLLCDCDHRKNVLGARICHEQILAEPEQCVWHSTARECTGATVLCQDCRLLVRGICPECPKGCICETTCTGWRHSEWRADLEDEDEGRWSDEDEHYGR